MTINRLDPNKIYVARHILVGFSHTEDACDNAFGITLESVGSPGDSFASGCGQSIVYVNESKDARYVITKAETTFNYFSPDSLNTTSLVGTLTLTDNVGGQYSDFCEKTAEKLGVAQTQVAFVIRTFFIGQDVDGFEEVIETNPLVFNMSNFTQAAASKTAHVYIMSFVGTYNTLGQDASFSKIHQMTITHKDGALHKTVPSPDAQSCGLDFRASEDAAKAPPRQTRLDKSKPMKTLGDVFDAFELELMEQKYEHKRQLQEWLSYVDDDYVKKIEVPKQTREVPIDYIMDVGQYKGYSVDNRNMPFEQPEQSQSKPGVRSITIQPGTSIYDAIDDLMKYSTQVGKDTETSTPTRFRSNLCAWRRCNGKYDVFIKVRGDTIPKNQASGTNTGPGQGHVSDFTVTFQDAGLVDSHIMQAFTKVASETALKMHEQQVDSPPAKIVMGDREQHTAERIPDKDPFMTSFSGIRPMLCSVDSGMESAQQAGNVEKYNSYSLYPQTSLLSVVMRGNPDLMGDFFRLPSDVAFDTDGNATFFKKPEVLASYAKIVMKIKPSSLLGLAVPGADVDEYYHVSYGHVYRLTSTIQGSSFTQRLELMVSTKNG